METPIETPVKPVALSTAAPHQPTPKRKQPEIDETTAEQKQPEISAGESALNPQPLPRGDMLARLRSLTVPPKFCRMSIDIELADGTRHKYSSDPRSEDREIDRASPIADINSISPTDHPTIATKRPKGDTNTSGGRVVSPRAKTRGVKIVDGESGAKQAAPLGPQQRPQASPTADNTSTSPPVHAAKQPKKGQWFPCFLGDSSKLLKLNKSSSRLYDHPRHPL